MSKKYLLVLSALLLVGCNSNNSTNSSNSTSKPSNSESSISNSSSASNTSSSNVKNDKISNINKKCELDFYDITSSLNTSYEDISKVVEEVAFEDNKEVTSNNALVHFEQVSRQNTTITNAPVIRAVKGSYEKCNYVTLLSSTPFNINKVSFAISIWNAGDFSHIGNEYYVGVEYLLNDTWTRLETIDLTNVNIGSMLEYVPYVQEIKASNVTDIRLAFDFPNATGDVRIGLNYLSYEGIETRYKEDKEITNIAYKEENHTLKINEELALGIIVTPNSKKDLVNFSSLDRSKAIIKNGKVMAISEGLVDILAYNGKVNAKLSLNIQNTSDDYSKLIQEKVEFNGSIPDGFSANFLKFYNGTYLNFSNTGNAVDTSIYPINGPTIVKLNMCWSSNNSDPSHGAKNIFSVIGYDENDVELEKVQKTGLINTDFEDVTFEFSNPNIRKYKIIYEFKNQDSTLGIYGKNYLLRYVTIYQK